MWTAEQRQGGASPSTDSAQEGAEHCRGAGADPHCKPHAPRAHSGTLPSKALLSQMCI